MLRESKIAGCPCQWSGNRMVCDACKKAGDHMMITKSRCCGISTIEKHLIEFHVPGVPVPQARARAFTRPGMKGVRFYDPATSKGWKQIVAAHVPKGTAPFPKGTALSLSVVFHMKAPKDRGPNFHHTRKPDLDNLVKAVKDALNGLCWEDDSQVVKYGEVGKHYALPGEEGVDVKIMAIR